MYLKRGCFPISNKQVVLNQWLDFQKDEMHYNLDIQNKTNCLICPTCCCIYVFSYVRKNKNKRIETTFSVGDSLLRDNYYGRIWLFIIYVQNTCCMFCLVYLLASSTCPFIPTVFCTRNKHLRWWLPQIRPYLGCSSFISIQLSSSICSLLDSV